MNATELVVFVDVDDTLVRSLGGKRIPIPAAIEHVHHLHQAGARLHCWSAGGADYARATAHELGLAACFTSFLPKPHVFLDDAEPATWPRCRVVHPTNLGTMTVDDHLRALDTPS